VHPHRWCCPRDPSRWRCTPAQTALIVVDMQNAYASLGGYVDSAGFDISGAQGTIANIVRTIEAARAAGILVVFLQNGWDAAYVEAGGPGSPNWYKSNALKTMRKKPELAGKFLAKGGWDYELIDVMKPQAGDIVVPKTRYSGFFNSTLDSTLRARGIRNLVFTGIATNVCVESTLRDAFHLEYFAVMLEDATHELGGAAIQKAAVYNVETFFGWVSTVDDFCRTVLRRAPAAMPRTRGRSAAIFPDPRFFRNLVHAQASHHPPRHRRAPRALRARHAGRRRALRLGHAALRQGQQRGPRRRRRAQTRHVLDHHQGRGRGRGGTMDDVTFNQIMIKDWADYAKINAVYAEFFPGRPSRRATASSAAW
jgi:ureidoacrylate peracid hydrolase